eukprot:m.262092 g.262092  ORF g.262092 m.262092 type:complete len:1241 (-) comp17605_c0_seq24:2338-6060(-)
MKMIMRSFVYMVIIIGVHNGCRGECSFKGPPSAQYLECTVWEDLAAYPSPEVVGDLRFSGKDATDDKVASLNWTHFKRLKSLHITSGSLTRTPDLPLAITLQMIALSLRDNAITQLEPNRLLMPELSYLQLDRNRISSVSRRTFEALTSLIGLRLDRNAITTFDSVAIFEPCSLLRILHLSSNSGIQEFNASWFGPHRGLRELRMATARISRLDSRLSEFTHLTVLDLRGNLLTEYPSSFASLIKLQILRLGRSVFDPGPRFDPHALDSNSQLTQLDLSSHPSSSSTFATWGIDFATKHPMINTLSFIGCNLSAVPEFVTHLTQLTNLLLPVNPLTTLPPIPGTVTTLHIASDDLVRIPPDALRDVRPTVALNWESQFGAICSYNDTWTCSCTNGYGHGYTNNLAQCMPSCPTLSTATGPIRAVTGDRGIAYACGNTSIMLQCSNSTVPTWELETDQPSGIICAGSFCRCSSNIGQQVVYFALVISSLKEIPFRDVTVASLAVHGQSPELAFQPARLIKAFNEVSLLKISDSSLSSLTGLDLSSLQDVTRLDLSWNQLTTVTDAEIGALGLHLQSLNLSHNAITSVHNAFASFGQVTQNGVFSFTLSVLDLSYNQLTYIDTSTLPRAGKLLRLDLAHNAIDYIQAGAIAPQLRVDGDVMNIHNMSRSMVLSMEGNPSRCTYDEIEFNSSYEFSESLVCNCSSNRQQLMAWCPRANFTLQCEETDSASGSVRLDMVCDGVQDCSNGNDEAHCGTVSADQRDTDCLVQPELEACGKTCLQRVEMMLRYGVLFVLPARCEGSLSSCSFGLLTLTSFSQAIGLLGMSTVWMNLTADRQLQVSTKYQPTSGTLVGSLFSSLCSSVYRLSGSFLSLPTTSFEPEPGEPSQVIHRRFPTWAIVVLVLALTVALVIAIVVFQWRRQRSSASQARHSYLLTMLSYSSEDNDFKLFNRSRFQIGSELGKGNFATVHSARVVSSQHMLPVGSIVALKSFPNLEPESAKSALSEVMLLHAIDHESIVRFYGVVQDTESLTLCLEYAAHGDLRHFVAQQQLSPSEQRIVLIQIATGLAYLHTELKILHRDLAARNVLVFSLSPLRCKLADFGLSRVISSSDYYRANSEDDLPYRWMSPEALRDHKFTFASDVWSFAVVVYEVLTNGARPYGNLSLSGVIAQLRAGQYLKAPPPVDASLGRIMSSCWVPVDQRPSISALCTLLTQVHDNASFDRCMSLLITFYHFAGHRGAKHN